LSLALFVHRLQIGGRMGAAIRTRRRAPWLGNQVVCDELEENMTRRTAVIGLALAVCGLPGVLSITTAQTSVAATGPTVCEAVAARKVVFRESTPAQKLAMFRHHITAAERQGQWSPEQKDVFRLAQELLKRDLYRMDGVEARSIVSRFDTLALRAWRGDAKVVARLFRSLDDSDLQAAGTPALRIVPARLILARSPLKSCTCMNGDDCGGVSCYGWEPPRCDPTWAGCGTWWLFSCTALCANDPANQ